MNLIKELYPSMLKRPEYVDSIYLEAIREDCSLVYVYNQVEPYIEPGDLLKYYGGFPPTNDTTLIATNASFIAHTFNFLWLILCIEGYES